MCMHTAVGSILREEGNINSICTKVHDFYAVKQFKCSVVCTLQWPPFWEQREALTQFISQAIQVRCGVQVLLWSIIFNMPNVCRKHIVKLFPHFMVCSQTVQVQCGVHTAVASILRGKEKYQLNLCSQAIQVQCGVHTAVPSTLIGEEGNFNSIYHSSNSSAVWCASPTLKYHLTCQMYVEGT